MSTRWYNILFRFEVLHEFYSDGISHDISIRPTDKTSAKISGYRHFLRYKENSPLVLFEAIDDLRSPLLPIVGDTRLVFTGTLKNPYFSNFTELPPKEADQVYLFDNLSGNTLQQTAVSLRPQVFTFSFTASRVNATLDITDRNGNIILSKAVSNSAKKFNEKLKLYGVSGFHRFTVTTTQGIEVDQAIYISNSLYKYRPWCIIEILQQGPLHFNYNAETTYQLQFDALQKPWHYNLNLTKDYLNASFLIEDKENYGPPKNDPYVKIDFVETSGSQTYEEGQTVNFISGIKVGSSINEQAIPFFEKPKKDLQLTISKNGVETIVRPLPIPSAISPLQEVYINI